MTVLSKPLGKGTGKRAMWRGCWEN
jgi:hypothetical protein